MFFDRPPVEWAVQLRYDYNDLHSKLGRLVGVDFSVGGRHEGHPIVVDLRSIGEAVSREVISPDTVSAIDVAIARLRSLVKDMSRIERVDPQLRARLAIRFLNDRMGYFGTRLETAVAAELCRRKRPFIHTEIGGPDFTISSRSTDVGVECTSTTLSPQQAPANKPLEYKLSSALRGKARKPYAGPLVALFNDYTNVLFHSVDGPRHMLEGDVMAAMEQELAGTPYGSLLLFLHTTKNEAGHPGFGRWYSRIDHPSIGEELRVVLDEFYPPPARTVRLGTGIPRRT
jgi:hypothetical protein